MRQKPQTAENSLLLDYVSPWNVITMFTSFKATHFVVTITILGSLVIKVLTIASTGLFILQEVTLHGVSADLVLLDKFDGSSYESSRVDGSASLTVAGISALNLTFPVGTTDQYAFQDFALQGTTPSK